MLREGQSKIERKRKRQRVYEFGRGHGSQVEVERRKDFNEVRGCLGCFLAGLGGGGLLIVAGYTHKRPVKS